MGLNPVLYNLCNNLLRGLLPPLPQLVTTEVVDEEDIIGQFDFGMAISVLISRSFNYSFSHL